MNPGYPFRLYASPWKLAVLMVISLVFVIIGYLMALNPRAQSGG
jgi:hypothetical protein